MQPAGSNSLHILIATTTAILVLVGTVLWGAAGAVADRAAMGARWLAHPVPHYRMTVARTGCFGAPCSSEVEVKDEKVIHAFHNSCSWPNGSITNLFDEVEMDRASRYDNNHLTSGPYVSYDEQWGYPTALATGTQRTFFVEAFTPLP